MHSSLAAVLTIAAFAAAGMTAAPVAAALVIGANLGGAVIPFTLLWSAPRIGRMVALGNLMARGGVTLVAVALLATGYLEPALFGGDAAQQVVFLHIAMNLVLAVAAVPLVTALVGLAGALTAEDADPEGMRPSALDPDVLGDPQVALACAQRELLRMAETVQRMLTAVMHLFRGWDAEVANRIERGEEDVDRMHFETKIYLAQLRQGHLPPEQSRRAVELVAMANGLEEAADRIAVNLLAHARKMHERAISFSDEGLADIDSFHDQIVTNTQLALSVLTTGDAEAARQLVAEKDRIRGEEQKLQERHLARLGVGASASVESTNVHQETLRLLKQINAAISYVAYPIAEETGDLLDSRLASPRRAGGHA
jgi:phosphate:Na+ symporter